jgi:4-diphosphocytidyl-2-C-methyl-D-erythritol kinase
VRKEDLIKTVRAPAKLNIRLKITGRRSNGYHELVSIMVPVDLFDRLELIPRSSGISLKGEGFSVPADESNLAFKAAHAFFGRTGIDAGVSIRLIKNIPVAAGLGGGSSDAAFTLRALNDLYSTPLSEPHLAEVAVGLGADVPFFLHCRPSLATGIGEILEPIENWPKLWYVIVTPPIRVSTAWVYENLKLALTKGEWAYIVNTLKKEHHRVSDILENDLETVTAHHFPVIQTIKKLLLEMGAEGALMSGSGPSVFGVFTTEEQALRAKRYLTSRNLGDVFAVTQYEESA